MIPVTYGYGRVSKTYDKTRNLATQLRMLQKFRLREEQLLEGWSIEGETSSVRL